jgi:protein TonB
VGRGVLAPKPTYVPKAILSDEARRFIRDQRISNFEAVSIVGLTMDEKGKPRDICVLKEAGHGLDKNAFDCAAKYRFEPATLDGKPVSVRVAVEVNFKSF